MSQFTITGVILEDRNFTVEYVDETGYPWSHSAPWGNLETLMAEYGLTDRAEALDILLHDPHMWAMIDAGDLRDDPAATAGWVTTQRPDAEPVTLFTARSTADARGAHRCRVAAVKAAGHAVFADPDRHLDRVLHARPLDPHLINEHRTQVDVHRWGLIYGGFPAPLDRKDTTRA